MGGAGVGALAPVFLVLGLGILVGRLGRIRADGIGPINVLVIEILIPAAVFRATIGAGRAGLALHAGFCVAILATMLAMFGIAFLLARASGRGRAEAAVLALLVGFPNLAAIGLPVAQGLGGVSGGAALDAALGIAIGSVLPSSITLAVLEAARRGGRPHPAALAGRAFLKPVVLAPVLGAGFALAGVAPPAPVGGAIAVLAAGGAAAALILTGLVLSAQRFRPDRLTLVLACLRNLGGPPAGLAIGRALGLDPADAAALAVLSAVPCGFFGLLFGLRYGVACSGASALLLLSTAAGLLTLPGWIALVGGGLG